MTSDHAVVAEALRKDFGGTRALDGLDLTVSHGTVHGVLGPNGAGKTTLVRALSTVLRLDGGRALVAGVDVRRHPFEVRRRIGLLGQSAALDEELSGRQNLLLFGRLHHLGRHRASARAEELLERFGLADTGRRPVRTYSGGMRRRLDLAVSFVVDPWLLFLDEPTTGLDPRGRAEVWRAVRSLVGAGTTVLLTTQYLEEADQLADRISVVDHGRVIAEGTADQLKSTVGGDRVDVVVRDPERLADAVRVLTGVPGCGAVERDEDRRRVSAPVADRMAALNHLVRGLHDAGVEVEDLTVRRPTLDEAFLRLTGQRPADPDTAGDPGGADPPAPRSPLDTGTGDHPPARATTADRPAGAHTPSGHRAGTLAHRPDGGRGEETA